ncbi:MAG: YbhB/YbcL family Raf kinase inhibitor-like protein [Myxococcales bacterium]|jgi:Raf kinase inhibitor-like YbhB/YbcL family protein
MGPQGTWIAGAAVATIGVAAWLLLGAAGSAEEPRPKQPEPSALKLQSSAFTHRGAIPRKHTCQGEDISPALAWSGAPATAKSFALIVDDPDAPDPDAPRMTWVHWVLFDIPALTTRLPENVKSLPPGTRQGLNDWKQTGYHGPCPPKGRHRYYFHLYALDVETLDLDRPTRAELDEAMAPHVIAEATLMGTYEKTGD